MLTHGVLNYSKQEGKKKLKNEEFWKNEEFEKKKEKKKTKLPLKVIKKKRVKSIWWEP